MADSESKELQVKPKQEVATPAERTRPGLVFTPNVDIFETDNEIVLIADMPGVALDGVSIDLRENTLTLTGEDESEAGENETALMTEYQSGKYYRQFTLSSLIDQDKIDANLADGVLRLSLPKIEKATPRKIEVKT